MKEPKPKPKPPRKLSRAGRQEAPRGDAARERIVQAALETFGLHGFAGASTRMLAQAAKVNVQAIQYYFGGKGGLYLAAADHIGGRIRGHLGPQAERIRERFQKGGDGETLTREEARALLVDLLSAAVVAIVQEESAPWARFVIREQMEPTEAFERIYNNFMQPVIAMARRLVGVLLEDDPLSEHVGVRTLATVGQVVFFRVGRAAVMRQLGWERIGPDELAAIRRMLEESVAAITPAREQGRSS